jgi:transcription termination factor Rho
MTADRLKLSDLKAQSPKDLLALAEELDIENASTMRKGEMMFQILRNVRMRDGKFPAMALWKCCKTALVSALARGELSAGPR